MRSTIITFLIIMLISGTSLGEPEIRGTLSELSAHFASIGNYVTLSGQSEIKVQADRAIVSIRVVVEDPSLHNALKSNQDLRARIYDTLNKRGISSDNISASKFSSTPKYSFWGKKPSSYKVENLIKITIENEGQYQDIAKILDDFKEVEYAGMEFEHSDRDGLKRKAIDRACDAVTKKKEIYENKFGLKLMPKKFTEFPVYDAASLNIAEQEGKYLSYRQQTIQEAAQPSMVMVGPSDFGEIVFRGYVIVEYYIKN